MSEAEQPGDIWDYTAGLPISNARWIGLKSLGIGVVLVGLNVFTLVSENRYRPFTLPLGFPALLVGLCLVAIGQPRSRCGAPALWGRVLLIASATIGTGLGFGLALSMCV